MQVQSLMFCSLRGGIAAMATSNGTRESARLSLLSVVLTAVVITVNHWYVLGPGALGVVSAYVVKDRDRFVVPPRGVVKIGVIVPTTGPYALLGNSYLKALQMAKDDLKGTKYQYELVIRGVGADPAKAAAVIRQV